MLELITVLASVYCDEYVTANRRMDCNKFSAASRTLVLDSCIKVFYRGKEAKVLINDRGPCTSNHCRQNTPHILKRELDLSSGLAKHLNFSGIDKIKYKTIGCKDG